MARFSLAFLWLWTALTSLWWGKPIGYEVLSHAGLTGIIADVALYGGSLLDAVIGVWLLSGKCLKQCYLLQIVVIIVYTLLLSVIDAEFWLHPFGPLSKNIPILVLLMALFGHAKP